MHECPQSKHPGTHHQCRNRYRHRHRPLTPTRCPTPTILSPTPTPDTDTGSDTDTGTNTDTDTDTDTDLDTDLDTNTDLSVYTGNKTLVLYVLLCLKPGLSALRVAYRSFRSLLALISYLFRYLLSLLFIFQFCFRLGSLRPCHPVTRQRPVYLPSPT